MILGYATEDGTKRYSERFRDIKYKELGNTTLSVSQIGFGSYRVDCDVEAHHLALKKALSEGINIIDTSSNYANGNSEKLIGEILNSLIEKRTISRDELVIVTKAGYIQGQNYEISQRRKQEGRQYEDLLEYGEGLEHCISPEFLEEQLTMSLERLDMAAVDFYLLHNPEYYLGWARKNGMDKEEASETYYSRIEKAFIHLEEEVRKGRISFYGISSNTFPRDEEDFEASSVKRILDIAQKVSKHHRFRLIQFPMNLFESSPGFVKTVSPSGSENASDKLTLLEYAKSNDLACLINRPLNVLLKDRILRLADVEVDNIVTEDKINKFILDMLSSEKKFRDTFILTIDLDKDTKKQLIDYLLVGGVFQQHWKGFKNYTQWYDVFTRYFTPRINSAIHLLQEKDLSMALSYWLDSYVESIERVFRSVDSYYKIRADQDNSKIKEVVADEMSSSSGGVLSNKLTNLSINALRSSEGVSSVLVGMRQEVYVEDMVNILREEIEQKNNETLWSKLNDKLDFLV